jgi:hypothetical protein
MTIAPLSKRVNGFTRAEAMRKRQRIRAAHEYRAKKYVRQRDRHACRVPGCDWYAQGYALHVAHLIDKGMGGDKRGLRTTRQTMITLCWNHHQGPISLHSKRLVIYPLTDAGTDGPCRFIEMGRAPLALETAAQSEASGT